MTADKIKAIRDAARALAVTIDALHGTAPGGDAVAQLEDLGEAAQIVGWARVTIPLMVGPICFAAQMAGISEADCRAAIDRGQERSGRMDMDDPDEDPPGVYSGADQDPR